jgi:predicted aspartyl protease
MILMSRVEGPLGVVRELTSLLDPGFAYSVILSRDAIDIGYPNASIRPIELEKIRPDIAPQVLGLRGIERSVLVTLAKVSVGGLVAKNVDALVLELDLIRLLPFDLILGHTFLKNFIVTYDYGKRTLQMEPLTKRNQ